MFKKGIPRAWSAAALTLVFVSAASASAQSDPVGYNALLASFSAAGLPAPGTGIIVEQNEAPLTSGGNNFAPDTTQPYLSGKTVFNMSGASSASGHASSVAQAFYGVASWGGFASGVTQADLFNANTWPSINLHVQSLVLPGTVANNPSVANFSWTSDQNNPGTSAYNNDVLRRFDWMINRDNLVAVVAVANGGGAPILPLMASGYNSIAVGLNTGASSTGPVPVTYGIDGPGRSKPDIVAPDPFSTGADSYATPVVAADATALVQVARTYASLSAGTNAAVVKAIVMASASKNPLPAWTHTPSAPLDPQYGVGQVNFNSSYQVMTAGPQVASTTSLAASTGWSYSTVNPSTSSGSAQTYYFQVPAGQPYDLSALLTWQRVLTPTMSGTTYNFLPSMATINLKLYQANSFTLGSLLQSSSSTIDNVQYLFGRALPAGQYALQVQRVDSLSGGSLGNFALAWQTQSVPLWAGTGNGSWNVASNWSTGFVPKGATYEAALIAPTVIGVNVTLDVPQTIGQLTFGNSASGNAGYTLSTGSAGSLTFSNSGSNSLLTVMSGSHVISVPVILTGGLTVTPSTGAAVSFAGVVSQSSGSQSITINGQGTLVLSGSNTFSGGATVSSGTLQIGAGGASGTPGPTSVSDFGTLSFARSDVFTMPVPITGSGQVVQLGPGALILPVIGDTYTGQTVIAGGALRAGAGIPSGSLLVLNGGVLESNGASATFTRPIGNASGNVEWAALGGGFSANGGLMSVNIGGFGTPQTLTFGSSPSQLQGPLIFGSLTANNETDFRNPINLNGTSGTVQVNVGQGGDFAKLLGAISNSTGTAGLTKTGNGLLVLAATNTYNGPTGVNAGMLQVSSTANLGSGGLAFGGGGTGVLEITGTSPFNSAMPIALNANGTIQDDSAHIAFSGPISGPGALIKTGTGILVLSGSDTYTGGTFVEGGKLIAMSSTAIANGTNLTIGNPAFFAAPIVPAPIVSPVAEVVPEPGALSLLFAVVVIAVIFHRQTRLLLFMMSRPAKSN
jgi:autotransporter-associated beta strand protein